VADNYLLVLPLQQHCIIHRASVEQAAPSPEASPSHLTADVEVPPLNHCFSQHQTANHITVQHYTADY